MKISLVDGLLLTAKARS